MKRYDQNSHFKLRQIRRISADVHIFHEIDALLKFINEENEEKICIIISGQVYKQILEKIHFSSDKQTIILLFTDSDQLPKSSEVFSKIEKVCRNFQELYDFLDPQQIYPSIQNSISQPNMNIQLSDSFIKMKIIIDHILQTNFTEKHRRRAFELLKCSCQRDLRMLNLIDTLLMNYNPNHALKIYITHTLFYNFINKAIRLMDINALMIMGFFIKDLHCKISQLHRNRLSSYAFGPTKLYRFDTTTKSDIARLKERVNGVITYNTFFSTYGSLETAENNSPYFTDSEDLIKLVLEITVDPFVETVPFAKFETGCPSEDEYIFVPCSIFRLLSVTPSTKLKDHYEVKLMLMKDYQSNIDTLCSEQIIDKYKRLPLQSLFNGPQTLFQPISDNIKSIESMKALAFLWFSVEHFYYPDSTSENTTDQELPVVQWKSNEKALLNHRIDPNFSDHWYVLMSTYFQCFDHHTLKTGLFNLFLGRQFMFAGDYKIALFFLKKSLKDQNSGVIDSIILSDTLYDISVAYLKLGDFFQTFKFADQALAIRSEQLPENDPKLADCYHNLCVVYFRYNNPSVALSLCEKAINIRKSLSENYPALADSYTILARFYTKIDDKYEALKFARKSLAIRLQICSKQSLKLADSYDTIGMCYYQINDPKTALEYCQKALDIRSQVYDDYQFDLAESHYHIGKIYLAMDDKNQALEWFKCASDVRRVTFTEFHPDSVSLYEDLANMYTELNEIDSAFLYTIMAYGIKRKVIEEMIELENGSTHRSDDVPSFFVRFDEIISKYDNHLSLSNETVQKGYRMAVDIYNYFACYLLKWNDHLAAIEVFQKMLTIQEKKLQSFDNVFIDLYERIANVYILINQPTEAIKTLEDLFAISVNKFGCNHPNWIKHYLKLTDLFVETGQFDRAIPCAKKVLEISQRAGNQDLEIRIDTLNQLSNIHVQLGIIGEAIYNLLEALQFEEQKPSYNLSVFTEYYAKIGDLQRRCGKFESALDYHHKILRVHARQASLRQSYLTNVYVSLFEDYFEMGNTKNAMLWLRIALKNANKPLLSPKLKNIERIHSIANQLKLDSVSTSEIKV